MSEGLPLLDQEHPWPGLFPYGEDAHAYFNGRERETLDLLRLVRRDTLTILYGQSGLGKSSLLKAGLFPRLREEAMLPVYLRLEFRNQEIGLREQVWNLLRSALNAAGIDGRPPRDDESLWAYFHAADVELWDTSNRIVTPVLVLDQFEEIVQAGEERQLAPRLDAFMEELADLVENRVPTAVTTKLEVDPDVVSTFDFSAHRFRCVISFREDFLPDLEQRFVTHHLSTKSRFRVTKMGADQALTAVEKTGGRLVDREVAMHIVNFVSAAAARAAQRSVEIEPALLSVVCFELNNRRLAQKAEHISADLLAGAQEQIIAEFYQRSIADLDPIVQTFIERELLTESGYRDSCALEDAVQRHGIAREALQKLVDRRLLRLEERFGVLRVELTHDVLTPVVRDRRDQRQAREAREREWQRDFARQKRTRLFFVVGGALIAGASVLLIVFFNLFRQAESEKARVIEAQSTLFLSRANASLDSNIPAEPVRYLAQSLALNPRNEGAIARLASLAVQRTFARKVWEKEFEQAGGSAGVASAGDKGGFAFLSANGDLRFAKILPGEPLPTLQESCAVKKQATDTPLQFASITYESVQPTAVSGAARIAETEVTLSPGNKSKDEYATFVSQCLSTTESKQHGGKANLVFKSVEAETGAIWALSGKNLLRHTAAGSVGEALPGLDGAGEFSRMMASPNGRAVIVVGDKAGLLYARTADAKGAGNYVLKATMTQAASESDQVVNVIAAAFNQAGSLVLVTLDDGTCHLWETASASKRWSRPCTKDTHVMVPAKPWIAFLGQASRGGKLNDANGISRGQIEIVDVANGRTLGFAPHPLSVNHIGFAASGDFAVVASQDRTARVYQLPTLTQVGSTLLHEGAVVEAHFRPGKVDQVITASFDGSARVWDWRLGKMIVEPLLHPGPVLFARPVLDGAYVLSLSDDRKLRLWHVDAPARTISASAQPLQLPAISPGGDKLAYIKHGDNLILGAKVTVARVSAVPMSAEPLVDPKQVYVAKGAVEGLFFSDDSRKLAVAGRDATLAIVDLDAGTALPVIRLPAVVERAKFVPDGKSIVVQLRDDSLHVISLVTGRETGLPVRTGESIFDFGISHDGKWLTVAAGAKLQVFDLRSGYPLARIAPGGIVAAASHPSKAEIAYATRSGLYFWRPFLGQKASGRKSAQDNGVSSKAARQFAVGEGEFIAFKKLLVGLRYTPDGTALAAYSIDGLASSWDTKTLEQGPSLRHSSSIVSMGMSGDGRWLTTTTLDGMARVWDYRTGQMMADAVDLQDSEHDFRIVGGGTWALTESVLGTHAASSSKTDLTGQALLVAGQRGYELNMLGLGFKEPPPEWFVPAVAALAGSTSEHLSSKAGLPRPDVQAASWWENWLHTVATKNGVNPK